MIKKTKLLTYYQKNSDTSPMKIDILTKYCAGSLSMPSEKQAKILYRLYNQALKEGVIL